MKEEDPGVSILSVLVTEPDSLLCADVKTCVLNSENAVRHPADVATADTHLRDVVIVQEREGSERQVSSKRPFPSEKFVTMDPSCLVRLSWCNGWHCCHISRNRRFEFPPEVFVRFS